MTRSRLILSSVLVAALVALAIGSGASSASRPTRSGAAAPVNLRFDYGKVPVGGVPSVAFGSGVQAINTVTASTQTPAAAMRAVVASQQGFAITATFATLDAGVDVQVQPKDGFTAIEGKAVMPAGTTLTVRVNGGPSVPIAGQFEIPLPTGAPNAAQPTACRAGKCIGTAGNDVLVGTQGADVIIAKGGNDQIRGLGGNDYICAGPGNDIVTAGSGHDQVLAGAGNDLVRAGLGHDYVSLGPGRDRGHGGAGNDGVIRDSRDTVTGGPGADHIIREPTGSLASRAALSGCREEG